jgi:hypothetical protein
MPIAEIIHEIDAYLSRLRQARELLSGRLTEAPQTELPGHRKKALVRRPRPAPPATPQAGGNKSQSNRPVVHQKEKNRIDEPAAKVSSAVIPKPAHSEQSATVQPENTTPQNVAITRLPASRRIRSFGSVDHRTANRTIHTKPASIQPAIALAGPTNARIVVVSADQIQRERAQAAQPAIRRPRIAVSGLSGRRAFEALFADASDSSKGSGQ